MSSDECSSNMMVTTSKKRQKNGRTVDVMKKLRLQTHEVGQDCRCKRLQCFQRTSSQERHEINLYLAGLISVLPICRRRSRQGNSEKYHAATYGYRVRVKRNDTIEEVDVCSCAFIAIHGITRAKLIYIQHSLKTSGLAPKDR
ncbi:hypothetical protein ABEB36_014624 [Hypothenemus hampei]|uniref:Uncharacterized protein n=1 Tax=Hypothenemus hampei TaxID=57062 RepID=A0ABD1E2C8_HYPHA